MGTNAITQNSCCACSQAPQEQEKDICNYNAYSDTYLSPIEDNYNLLQKITINEFITNFLQFNQTGPILSNQLSALGVSAHVMNQPIGEDVFKNFIDSKIKTSDKLYNYTNDEDNNQFTLKVFNDYMLETYRELRKNCANYSEDKFNIIKKYNLLPLGIIYCEGRNKEKIEFIYKVFKNENNNIQKSLEFNNFLICLFLIPSCCQVNVRMKLAVKYPSLGDISKQDMISILDAFELVDIERLVGICNKSFFKEKKELSHEEFIGAFDEKDLQWMLKASGIRANLEKNNDVKATQKRLDYTQSVMTSEKSEMTITK